ncbi:hypothetical protein FNV43_RR10890 [Rhamnella rubrinervis]|uniref:Uncharacterized protein n=1 Tax=Rhamnella rubrinervis TaxID=2594499 RepID=A0A8K0MGR5_9ROSA|nr:hypothetical protein FNV43_RR10890 [Rhamnella rubrinervis]
MNHFNCWIEEFWQSMSTPIGSGDGSKLNGSGSAWLEQNLGGSEIRPLNYVALAGEVQKGWRRFPGVYLWLNFEVQPRVLCCWKEQSRKCEDLKISESEELGGGHEKERKQEKDALAFLELLMSDCSDPKHGSFWVPPPNSLFLFHLS